MKKKYLEVGKIVGTHGLKGEVRIEPWCDSPEFLARFRRLYDKDGKEIKVRSARAHKNITIVLLEGVSSIEEADLLRGRIVYINRDDVRLPEGVCFVQDLIGLDAEDADSGEFYGKVTDVIQTGANDVYQITKDGRDYLIPKIPDVVSQVDIDGGKILINTKIVGGLFDDED